MPPFPASISRNTENERSTLDASHDFELDIKKIYIIFIVERSSHKNNDTMNATTLRHDQLFWGGYDIACWPIRAALYESQVQYQGHTDQSGGLVCWWDKCSKLDIFLASHYHTLTDRCCLHDFHGPSHMQRFIFIHLFHFLLSCWFRLNYISVCKCKCHGKYLWMDVHFSTYIYM